MVNSSGVCLGKLCVHIRIELSAQLNKESTKKQRKVNFDQPEFIVGPGARFGGSRAHGSPLSSPSKDVGTVVGGQDRVGSSHGHSSAPKETHTPTDRGELEGCVLEGTELGARQIEVISELIERGQQLRNRMVESIVTQGGNGGERYTGKKQLTACLLCGNTCDCMYVVEVVINFDPS